MFCIVKIYQNLCVYMCECMTVCMRECMSGCAHAVWDFNTWSMKILATASFALCYKNMFLMLTQLFIILAINYNRNKGFATLWKWIHMKWLGACFLFLVRHSKKVSWDLDGQWQWKIDLLRKSEMKKKEGYSREIAFLWHS